MKSWPKVHSGAFAANKNVPKMTKPKKVPKRGVKQPKAKKGY